MEVNETGRPAILPEMRLPIALARLEKRVAELERRLSEMEGDNR